MCRDHLLSVSCVPGATFKLRARAKVGPGSLAGSRGVRGRAAGSRAPGNGEGADPGPQSWGQVKMRRERMGTKNGGLVPPGIGKASLSAVHFLRARLASPLGTGTPCGSPAWQGTDSCPPSLPVLSRAGELRMTPMRGTRATWGSFPAPSGNRGWLLWGSPCSPRRPAALIQPAGTRGHLGRQPGLLRREAGTLNS